jgi:hypothetical protein
MLAFASVSVAAAHPPPVHPQVEPIAFLLGTWTGEGRGEYPTITDFGYGEEVRFWHVGKPFLAYAQRTWALDDGRPLHAEMGYWRPQPDGSIEVLLSHPTGVNELATGALHGTRIELSAQPLTRSPTAKEVTRVERTFDVDPAAGELRYTLRMAAVGVQLTHHLSAVLRRAPQDPAPR